MIILNQVFKFYYYYLRSISLIVWKLWAFRHRRNFGNFRQFFYHNYRLKEKFKILMVSSEISRLDLSESTPSYISKIYFFTNKNLFFGEKIRFFRIFFTFFFELLQKFDDFVNFDYCIGKISSRSIRSNPNIIEKPIFWPCENEFRSLPEWELANSATVC